MIYDRPSQERIGAIFDKADALRAKGIYSGPAESMLVDLVHEFRAVTRERKEAEGERDSLLYAVGRAVLPEMNERGRTYPWVKTAIGEIERMAAELAALRKPAAEPTDITADDIIPPITAGRVRGIARVWLKPQSMKAEADLLALASWLDRYHAMMRDVLKESDAANG